MANGGLFNSGKTMKKEIQSMSVSQALRLLEGVYGVYAKDIIVIDPESYEVSLKIAILVKRGLYEFADYGVSYALMSVGNRAWRVLQNMLNDGGAAQYLCMCDGDFVKKAIKAAREEH